MRTVFITCFTGLISRNILATDAFWRLKNHPDLRIVLIAPESRRAELEDEFGAPNVAVEGVLVPPLKGTDWILWVLATNLLNTNTRRVQRLARLAYDRSWFKYFVSLYLSWLGRARALRTLFRFFVARFAKTQGYQYLFERYRPDLLFATDVYTFPDVKLMLIAKRRGVKTVGMVRSWDNPTSKTLLMFIPEKLVVNTERIREEAVRLGDVPAERITVVGIPHYERYRSQERTLREVFFRKLSLDPRKPLILFTPPSDNYLKEDPITPVALEALARVGAQVLVRFPLVGDVELAGFKLPPDMVFDEPGKSPDFTEVHLSREADRHLADSIYHSDFVVTWASTMIIDAAVFGKPIILIGFDAAPRPYAKSITRYYDYDHQQRILETGGARLVKSPKELIDWCRRYLENPKIDKEGRARIVTEYCGKLDGKSGERLAAYLLQFV